MTTSEDAKIAEIAALSAETRRELRYFLDGTTPNPLTGLWGATASQQLPPGETWYSCDGDRRPEILALAGAVRVVMETRPVAGSQAKSERLFYWLLSANRRAAIAAGLALALTLPQNQVHFQETTADHLRRLAQLRGDPKLQFRYIKAERERLAAWLRGEVIKKPVWDLERLLADLALTATQTDQGWQVAPTEPGPSADPVIADAIEKHLVGVGKRRRQDLVNSYIYQFIDEATYERRRDELIADGLITPLSPEEQARRRAEVQADYAALGQEWTDDDA